MSVYLSPKSPFYQYDFWWRRRRFHGSTGCKDRRKAEIAERLEKDRVKEEARKALAASSSLKIDDVVGRYWSEAGQHHAGKKDTWRDLERLVDYFTPTKLLTEITDDDVARLVAWRRGHRVERAKKPKVKGPLVRNATVNRSTIEVLKKLFTRAKRNWGVRFEREPDWKSHFLEESQERVRELVGNERQKLEQATREDYGPFFAFAAVAGLRLNECLLRWPEVNWEGRQIAKPGKGKKLVTAPITPTIRAILWPLRGHHPEKVFTYVAKRNGTNPDGSPRVKGKRYPITYSGVKIMWRRIRGRSGVKDFRFHDFRHDVATKLLRETGNLKLVQKALNHADIKTTMRYAHVLEDEVAAALERVANHRSKSRNGLRKVAK